MHASKNMNKLRSSGILQEVDILKTKTMVLTGNGNVISFECSFYKVPKERA
jgi:hypothetical protein